MVVEPQVVHSTMPLDINVSQASLDLNQDEKLWAFSHESVNLIMTYRYVMGWRVQHLSE